MEVTGFKVLSVLRSARGELSHTMAPEGICAWGLDEDRTVSKRNTSGEDSTRLWFNASQTPISKSRSPGSGLKVETRSIYS